MSDIITIANGKTATKGQTVYRFGGTHVRPRVESLILERELDPGDVLVRNDRTSFTARRRDLYLTLDEAADAAYGREERRHEQHLSAIMAACKAFRAR